MLNHPGLQALSFIAERRPEIGPNEGFLRVLLRRQDAAEARREAAFAAAATAGPEHTA